MNQKIALGVISLLVLGALAYVFMRPQERVENTAQQPSGQSEAQESITMAEVAQHASRESCYTVIRGEVYDLTGWIANHPGGQAAILGLCGRDGTDAFMNQHGGSSRQENILAGFRIGTLVQ